MIRVIVGIILVMGAVGGMDEPENSLLVLIGIAGIGLGLMYWGTEKLKQM
jgi:small-conductance mechanosensitive channel